MAGEYGQEEYRAKMNALYEDQRRNRMAKFPGIETLTFVRYGVHMSRGVRSGMGSTVQGVSMMRKLALKLTGSFSMPEEIAVFCSLAAESEANARIIADTIGELPPFATKLLGGKRGNRPWRWRASAVIPELSALSGECTRLILVSDLPVLRPLGDWVAEACGGSGNDLAHLKEGDAVQLHIKTFSVAFLSP